MEEESYPLSIYRPYRKHTVECGQGPSRKKFFILLFLLLY